MHRKIIRSGFKSDEGLSFRNIYWLVIRPNLGKDQQGNRSHCAPLQRRNWERLSSCHQRVGSAWVSGLHASRELHQSLAAAPLDHEVIPIVTGSKRDCDDFRSPRSHGLRHGCGTVAVIDDGDGLSDIGGIMEVNFEISGRNTIVLLKSSGDHDRRVMCRSHEPTIQAVGREHFDFEAIAVELIERNGGLQCVTCLDAVGGRLHARLLSEIAEINIEWSARGASTEEVVCRGELKLKVLAVWREMPVRI